jgi:hypothetical protein
MLFQFPNSGGISLHGAPVRVCHASVFPCLSGQQFFYPFPRLVAYIMPVNTFIFFHASYFISFPFF